MIHLSKMVHPHPPKPICAILFCLGNPRIIRLCNPLIWGENPYPITIRAKPCKFVGKKCMPKACIYIYLWYLWYLWCNAKYKKQKTGTTFHGSSRFTVHDYSCAAPGYCYCGRLFHPFSGLHRLWLCQPLSLLHNLLRSCFPDVRSMVYGSSFQVAGTFIPIPRIY